MSAALRTRSTWADPQPEIPAREARRILAIDYGRRRIGLAVSDEMGVIAQPLITLVRANRQADVRRLREICRKYAVRHIIVGYPLHMNGEPGEMAVEASRFAKRLEKHLGISAELVDERLTTWEAKQTVPVTETSRRTPGSLDRVAAALLLRDYLRIQHGRLNPPVRRE